MPLLLPFIAAALVNGAVGAEVRISSASDLIQFSNNVNSGSTYYGSTVFLDSDIDLSGKTFEPIGAYYSSSDCNYISKCVFDGQGHVIKNLAMASSSSQLVGFFGFVIDSTIKNLVIDSSCTIDSQYESSALSAFVGGVVGDPKKSMLKNVVNMGSVKFSGDVSGYDAHIGGIIGHLFSNGYSSSVVNCANYGTVTDSGKSAYSYAGGIAGYLDVNQTTYIQNCLNYGSIAQSGTTSEYQYSGGIVGYSKYAVIENCMSYGKITASNWFDYYIGSIVGKVYSSTSILHSFWTSNVGYGAVGTGSPSVDSQTSEKTLGADLVNDLSSYKSTWNNWLLNSNGDSVYFAVGTNSNAFVLTSKIILVPDIANFSYYIPSITCTIKFVMSYGLSVTQTQTLSYGKNIVFPKSPTVNYCYSVSAWYEDSAFTKPFTETTATRNVTLYAKFAPKKYTVVFDFGDGTSETKSVTCGSSISYPTIPEKEGYSLDGWYEDSSYKVKFTGTTVDEDMTLYGKWVTKVCTVKFDFGGGSSKSVDFEYGDYISYPETPEKEGYSFVGWYEDSSYKVKFTGTTVTDDMTLYGKWTEKVCTVKFDFGDGTSKSVDFEYGDYISYPETPEKEGYSLDGWYEDESCTHEYMLCTKVSTYTKVTKNMTLYAKWVSNMCTVVFDFGDGTSKAMNFTCGSSISFPTIPEKEGYSFNGWYEDESCTYEYSSCTKVSTYTTVTEDVTLYGTYVDLKNASGAHKGYSIMSAGTTLFLALLLLLLSP